MSSDHENEEYARHAHSDDDLEREPEDEVLRREDSEDEGEDLIDDERMIEDYRHIPELDRYDSSQIDSQDYDDLDADARRAAEAEMARRDRKRGRGGARDSMEFNSVQFGVSAREPAALRSSGGMSEDSLMDQMDNDELRPQQRRRLAELAVSGRYLDVDNFNLEDFVPPLSEWILSEGPRREIRRRFRKFLNEFLDQRGRPFYAPKISTMCAENKESFSISYMHLSQACSTLAIWTADCPRQMLEVFDEEAFAVVLAYFPQYNQVHSSVHVRIADLPVSDSIRDLRQEHLNALIKVQGVVTRRTSVFPQLLSVKFACKVCSQSMGPFYSNGSQEIQPPARCSGCESGGQFTINSQETVYRNYQKITIQEKPGSVPAGRVPRTKEVILTNDLKDIAKPGEIIDVTGIYMNNYDAALNTKHGFPVFSTIIEANHISKPKTADADGLTDEDVRAIREYAQNPNIGELIKNSMAPSIFGHDDIKMAIALALFGGQAKSQPNLHRIRGDINILMLGDPGTAKSQFLKYAEKTADRAVFTTGKGASAVGLTASVRRDPMTREWTLEGGALVLADQGVCLIDEFDKMNDQDRTSIHEAMEQQSISISKAGIVTSLQARCSVIAAANPVKGRYDSSITFAENVELTDPILSRFDILCVVRDTVDPVIDERLALHVVQNHMNSHPEAQNEEKMAHEPLNMPPTMNQELLRKYIRYAKQHIHPRLTDFDTNRITQLYVELREQSARTGGIPITVRHVESIVRMSEAHAKMHLRQVVNQSDVDMAIRVMLQSFIETQKFQVMNMLRKKFKKFITYKRDNNELLFFLLKNLITEQIQMQAFAHDAPEDLVQELGDEEMPRNEATRLVVNFDSLLERAKEYEIDNINPFLSSNILRDNGFVLDEANRAIIRE